MNQKKPLGLILLTIFITWGILKSFVMFFHTSSIDLQLLTNFELGSIYYIFLCLNIFISCDLLYTFHKAKEYGYRLFKYFCYLNIGYQFLVLLVSLLQRKELEILYRVARENRGLSTESVWFFTQPVVLVLTFLIYTFVFLFLRFFLYRKKSYFVN